MLPSSRVLEAVHQTSFRSRPALERAGRAGCFYCQKRFATSDIDIWVDSDDTALCPHCSIDSVVPDSASRPLTPALLAAMNAYWFQRTAWLPEQETAWSKLRVAVEPWLRRLGWEVRRLAPTNWKAP